MANGANTAGAVSGVGGKACRVSSRSGNGGSKGVSRDGRSRNWCFTLNNPGDGDEANIGKIDCRYIVFGREVGANGTPHLQGYVVFLQQNSLKKVKDLFKPMKPHLEAAKGSVKHNYVYCTKDGEFVERGERPKTQAEKGEEEALRWKTALVNAKSGNLDAIPDDIRFRYYRTCKEIKKDYMVMPSDLDGVSGVWIYGGAGVGKSRQARIDYPGSYMKMCNKWWDGYQDEESVIIDDIDKKHDCLGHHLKIWSDRYAFMAEIKGGAVSIRPKKIVVTSQYSIEDIWDDVETRDALKRRFHCIHLIGLSVAGQFV